MHQVKVVQQPKETQVRNILHKNFQTVDGEYKTFFSKYGNDLSVILRIIPSNEKVNIQRFQSFCNDTYAFLVSSMPWVSINSAQSVGTQLGDN